MLNVDGAAAVEDLRAELARAKEQARRSDAAASKAAEELKAEKAAHCRSREEMAGMAAKLKDDADRFIAPICDTAPRNCCNKPK